MRAVVQRVSEASVTVEGDIIGSIKGGLMVLLGVKTTDSISDADYIVDKVANLRIFDDNDGVMNLSLLQNQGEVLLVSQFTLYGDARKGRRPSYQDAAKGDIAVNLYEYAVSKLKELGINVQTGKFGADMKVSLINDGPVTILLDSSKVI